MISLHFDAIYRHSLGIMSSQNDVSPSDRLCSILLHIRWLWAASPEARSLSLIKRSGRKGGALPDSGREQNGRFQYSSLAGQTPGAVAASPGPQCSGRGDRLEPEW